MEYDTRSGSKKLNKNLLFTEKILKQSVWTGTKYQSKKKKKKIFFSLVHYVERGGFVMCKFILAFAVLAF